MSIRVPDKYAGFLGISLLTAGLVLGLSLWERTLVPDGHLESQPYRVAILLGQLSLLAAAFYFFARQGIPRLLAAAPVVAALFFVQQRITETGSQQVLDCSYGEGNCFRRTIDHYFGTADCWGNTPRGCTPMRGRLADVAYVADATNYVYGPVTDEELEVEVLDADLEEPWNLEFLPDGSMIVTERGGRVLQVGRGPTRVLLELETLAAYNSGLLGLAVDPEFTSTRTVYLYYTLGFDTTDPARQQEPPWTRPLFGRVARFQLTEGGLEAEHPVLDSLPGSAMHPGGRLKFGPDGKLYVTVGDAHNEVLAQDPSSLAGKILRLNPDGSVPDDNPITGSYVYSLGHRHAQGLAWDPRTGSLFASEHGPDRYDEINRILPGGNYGWPVFSCDDPQPSSGPDTPVLYRGAGETETPAACFKVYTLAPSGMTFVPDTAHPWYRDLFVASLRGKHLRRFRVADDGTLDEGELFFVSEGRGYRGMKSYPAGISHRLRAVEYRDGSLYVIGDGFGIARISPARGARSEGAAAP